MKQEYIRILMIEDNLGDARLISEMVTESMNVRCKLDHAFRLSTGLERIRKEPYDVILLDLGLPDSIGLDTLQKVHTQASQIPIVIMTGLEDEDLATRAVQMGAQDYLVKLQIDSNLLIRSMRYAIERKKVEKQLRVYSEELQKSRDLLEEKAQELNNLNSQLNDLNAGKDKFFSIISHDLRSPFHGLLNLSQAMAEEFETFSPEELKEYSKHLYDATKKLFNLVENLLQWSRIESGRIEYNPVNIELLPEVAYNISLFHGNFLKKNIASEICIEPGIIVHADQNMVDSVLQNLISNAIKFTFSGGKVKVSSAQKNGEVEISISDTGTGMESYEIENLFRIDKRQSREGTEEEKGTGLGLILCKELVEKQGGRIWAESQTGKGSTFTFTLPGVS